jgi:hypothetical protein
MDRRMVELALRKQRLQFLAEQQRADVMQRLAGIDRVLDAADGLRDNLQWAKEKAPILSVALLLLIAARPRAALRLARRAWFGLLLYKRLRGRMPRWLTPAVAGVLAGVLGFVRRALERATTKAKP